MKTQRGSSRLAADATGSIVLKEGLSGRDVLTFATQAGVSRTTIYALLPEFQPRSVMIGKRRVYTEAPADWLQRIAASGGATTRQQHPSTSRKRRAS